MRCSRFSGENARRNAACIITKIWINKCTNNRLIIKKKSWSQIHITTVLFIISFISFLALWSLLSAAIRGIARDCLTTKTRRNPTLEGGFERALFNRHETVSTITRSDPWQLWIIHSDSYTSTIIHVVYRNNDVRADRAYFSPAAGGRSVMDVYVSAFARTHTGLYLYLSNKKSKADGIIPPHVEKHRALSRITRWETWMQRSSSISSVRQLYQNYTMYIQIKHQCIDKAAFLNPSKLHKNKFACEIIYGWNYRVMYKFDRVNFNYIEITSSLICTKVFWV